MGWDGVFVVFNSWQMAFFLGGGISLLRLMMGMDGLDFFLNFSFHEGLFCKNIFCAFVRVCAV